MRQIRILFLSAPLIFAVIAVLLSTVAVSGQPVASSGSVPADTVYAQPGQLVDAGGFRLNLYCMLPGRELQRFTPESGVCLEGTTPRVRMGYRRRIGIVNGNAEAGARLTHAVRLVAITATQFMAASQASR
jgi:hypothetical protein